MKSPIKTIILCGGKGTRLREKTESIPKPLIEIGGRPILWHIMKIYAAAGFNDFVLCLGYKGELIRKHFARTPESWNITFADTGVETATGERVLKAGRHVGETFMVTYGDGVADIDIKKLVAFHQGHGKTGTVTAVRPPLPFGVMDLSERGVVKNFSEKPVLKNWINGGFFVFRRDMLKLIKPGDMLEREPLERLARARQLVAYRHHSFWKCMDTYKDTVSLNEIWRSKKAAWKKW